MITILGCGGSDGVPQIRCNCLVCKTNNRTRTSIVITSNEGKNLLIDTSPDLRLQTLREKIMDIEAVLFTHPHYDHIAGIGDLRHFTDEKNIPIFGDIQTITFLTSAYKYLFNNNNVYYPAKLQANIFYGSFSIPSWSTMTIQPFYQKHGNYFSYGFRIGNIVYATDVSVIIDYTPFYNADILFLDCFKYHKSLTHLSFDDAIQIILKVKPKKTIFIHMSHDIDYNDMLDIAAPYAAPGYDGMQINFNGEIIK